MRLAIFPIFVFIANFLILWHIPDWYNKNNWKRIASVLGISLLSGLLTFGLMFFIVVFLN